MRKNLERALQGILFRFAQRAYKNPQSRRFIKSKNTDQDNSAFRKNKPDDRCEVEEKTRDNAGAVRALKAPVKTGRSRRRNSKFFIF